MKLPLFFEAVGVMEVVGMFIIRSEFIVQHFLVDVVLKVETTILTYMAL